MIKIGQVVLIVSCENTIKYCDRRSKYDGGDNFTVKDITDNTRGSGLILSDNDFNFIHDSDVQYEFEVSDDH